MTAFTAAVAMAVPLYVLPWSPGSNTAATSRRPSTRRPACRCPSPWRASRRRARRRRARSRTTGRCGRTRSGSRRPSSARRSRRRARGSRQVAGGAGFTPPSPWTGSISTAATVRVDGAARASSRPTRRGGSPPASAGTARAWSAGRSPRARPACGRGSCRARLTTWRPRPPCLRASLIAHSLASAPELVKKTWPSWPVASQQVVDRSPPAVATGLAKKLLTCSSSPAWWAIASATTGLACPSDVTAMPAQEVEVALPVDVPQLGAASRARTCTCGGPNTGMNGQGRRPWSNVERAVTGRPS